MIHLFFGEWLPCSDASIQLTVGSDWHIAKMQKIEAPSDSFKESRIHLPFVVVAPVIDLSRWPPRDYIVRVPSVGSGVSQRLWPRRDYIVRVLVVGSNFGHSGSPKSSILQV